MSTVHTPSHTDPRAERLLAALAELTEIGLDLARSLRAEAAEAAGAAAAPQPAASQSGHPRDGGDIALRFSRVARAVRQSVALEARLARELAQAPAEPKTPTAAELQRQAEAAKAARRRCGFERKAKAAYLVESTLVSLRRVENPDWTHEKMGDDDESDEDFDRMSGRVAEWLFDGWDDAAFAERPMGEIILDICRAIGVEPDPELWGAGEFEARVKETYAGIEPIRAPPDGPDFYDLGPGGNLSSGAPLARPGDRDDRELDGWGSDLPSVPPH